MLASYCMSGWMPVECEYLSILQSIVSGFRGFLLSDLLEPTNVKIVKMWKLAGQVPIDIPLLQSKCDSLLGRGWSK